MICIDVRTRLPSKAIAALLAPFVLVASAAQGVTLMRCVSSGAVACCCSDEGVSAPRTEVVRSEGQCCVRAGIPAAQPQIEQRSAASVPAPLATVGIEEPLPFLNGLQRVLSISRFDLPPAPSPLLATCALLI
jgi:hypothetical protein